MRSKKLIDKKAFKKFNQKCYFCDETEYAALECHRILPGEEGGKYTPANTVVMCASCHRKLHAGKIKIFRKYRTSAGKQVLHYIDECGIERFK